jgi:hypothetical protein
MPARKDPDKFRLGPRLFRGATNGLHAGGRELMLSIGDPPGLLLVLGLVWKEDKSGQGERDGDYAVNDK